VELPRLGLRSSTAAQASVHRQLAGFRVLGPVVGRVVGYIEYLLPEAKVGAQLSRAHKILTNVGVGLNLS